VWRDVKFEVQTEQLQLRSVYWVVRTSPVAQELPQTCGVAVEMEPVQAVQLLFKAAQAEQQMDLVAQHDCTAVLLEAPTVAVVKHEWKAPQVSELETQAMRSYAAEQQSTQMAVIVLQLLETQVVLEMAAFSIFVLEIISVEQGMVV
jgi:hypothetical protein